MVVFILKIFVLAIYCAIKVCKLSLFIFHFLKK